MTTLIIPCAGKSSRFPNMKPKYLLTHPDGRLMIEKAIETINFNNFDRVIITIVKPHDKIYEAGLILCQIFKNNPIVELCILDDFTSSASETIYLTLKNMNIHGAFVVKDSDNSVSFEFPIPVKNSIVGYDLSIHSEISNIPSKSFLVINEQNFIQDIIEKQIVSNVICLGVYIFEDSSAFIDVYEELCQKQMSGEMYISHIVSYLLSKNNIVFTAVMATDYQDWGTLREWEQEQKRCRTYFIDIDGVLIRNSGKYGKINWDNNNVLLEENIKVVRELQEKGAQIVVTTSRGEEYRGPLQNILSSAGITPYAILMGMNHAARVVINDFAPTNPYPSCRAISLPRNAILKDYLI